MEEEEGKERQWPASETLLFFPHVFLFILQTKLAMHCLIWFQTSMSVMRDLTIAVLMRFVITPKDPTTALVSLDIREMDGPVQVNDGFGEWRKVSWQTCCDGCSKVGSETAPMEIISAP